MHAVLARLSVHPTLHELHFDAPFMGQAAPVCATPLGHAQPFTTRHFRNTALESYNRVYRRFSERGARTNTRASVVGNHKAAVT